jgi:hypothetical protein
MLTSPDADFPSSETMDVPMSQHECDTENVGWGHAPVGKWGTQVTSVWYES